MSRSSRRVAVLTPESFSLGTPATLDQNDAGQVYTLGTQFTVSKAGLLTAVDWFAPSTLVPLSYQVAVYVAGGALLTSQAVSPVAGIRQRFYLTQPQALAVGTTYTVAVLTQHYAFSPAAGVALPASTAHMTIPAAPGFFNAGAALARPDNGPTANFYFVCPVATF